MIDGWMTIPRSLDLPPFSFRSRTHSRRISNGPSHYFAHLSYATRLADSRGLAIELSATAALALEIPIERRARTKGRSHCRRCRGAHGRFDRVRW